MDIRDNERKGRADVEMINEGSEPEAVIEVSVFFPSIFFVNLNSFIKETSGIYDCGCDKDFI